MRDQHPGRPRGHDLIFLSEFPLGLLSDRPLTHNPTSLTFKVGEKEMKIRASEDLGLPTPTDTAILLCVLDEAIRQGCPEMIEISRYQITRRLGWQRNTERYQRFHLALDRLVGTTYYAVNHYPDPGGKRCVERMAFHLLDEFHLHDSNTGGVVAGSSWVRLGSRIQALLRTRQLKPLDLDRYLEFRSAITQSLYRYLHTRRLDGKTEYTEGLGTLGFERLGLSRSYRKASDLKRKLDVAHNELRTAGFLTDVHYVPTADGRQEKVAYRFVARVRGVPQGEAELTPTSEAAPAVLAALPALAAPLIMPPVIATVSRLVELGVGSRVAATLVRTQPEEVERQLAYWPYREQVRNPGGALRRAIEEEWPAPPRWQARHERGKTARAKPCPPQEEVASPVPDALLAAFDLWWTQLPEAERERLTARAMAELIGESPVVAQHYERHPHRLPEALGPILQRLSGWSGPDPQAVPHPHPEE